MNKKQSLTSFAFHQRIKDCPVCALPEEIIEQLCIARKKKIPRTVVVEWLRDVMQFKIGPSDLEVHYNGRHDQRRAEIDE